MALTCSLFNAIVLCGYDSLKVALEGIQQLSSSRVDVTDRYQLIISQRAVGCIERELTSSRRWTIVQIVIPSESLASFCFVGKNYGRQRMLKPLPLPLWTKLGSLKYSLRTRTSFLTEYLYRNCLKPVQTPLTKCEGLHCSFQPCYRFFARGTPTSPKTQKNDCISANAGWRNRILRNEVCRV